MKITYRVTEHREAEGEVELGPDQQDDYRLARDGGERWRILELAAIEHAHGTGDWVQDRSVAFSRVTQEEDVEEPG